MTSQEYILIKLAEACVHKCTSKCANKCKVNKKELIKPLSKKAEYVFYKVSQQDNKSKNKGSAKEQVTDATVNSDKGPAKEQVASTETKVKYKVSGLDN